MSSPFGPLALIANPQAGRGRGQRELRRVEGVLAARNLDYEVQLTARAGDGTRLAREVLEGGGRFVVAMGGDGTVHEVVNGMFAGDATVVPDPVLGVIGAGSGSDYIRTFGLPSRAVAAAERLAGPEVRPVDVARISYADSQGRPAVRYFANIAEAGLGAVTAARAAALPAALGPSRYFFGFWTVLPGYKPGTMRIDVDGTTRYEGRVVNAVLANGRYFGGGMHISPASDPGDGTLEVLVFKGRKTDSFTMLPQVYRGRHVPHRNIVELKGQRFHLSSDEPFAVEADGEVLGTTPLTVEVVRRAISLKV